MISREDWHPLVRPLALVVALVAVAFWDRSAPTQGGTPIEQIAQEDPPAPVLTGQRLLAAQEHCSRKSGEEFRHAWEEGPVSAADWKETAQFNSHYNEKYDVCFYFLEIVRRAPGETALLSKMIYDVDSRELYGEYRGPESGGAPGAGMPEVCRVENLYCASRSEWERLAETYMKARAEVR